MKSTRLNRLGISIALAGFAATGYAHEDLDLGIVAVSLDKSCRAQIKIKNFGESLPESFYQTVTPAYITIVKGGQTERSNSLRKLDKQRLLQVPGGELTILSELKYQNIPQPMELELHIIGEFSDYGEKNNQLAASLDCQPNIGQIAGLPIIYTQPDVVIAQLALDPHTCELSALFINVTGVPLPDSAWNIDGGVSVKQLNLTSHEHVQSQSLAQLDPQQHFTRTVQQLPWRYQLPPTRADRWRVGMWAVSGDRNFSNNQMEIDVPATCRSMPGKP